jgi:hypothetical protein
VRNSKQTKLCSVMLRCLKLRFNLGSGIEVDSLRILFFWGPSHFLKLRSDLNFLALEKEILPLFCILFLLFYFELSRSFVHFERHIIAHG